MNLNLLTLVALLSAEEASQALAAALARAESKRGQQMSPRGGRKQMDPQPKDALAAVLPCTETKRQYLCDAETQTPSHRHEALKLPVKEKELAPLTMDAPITMDAGTGGDNKSGNYIGQEPEVEQIQIDEPPLDSVPVVDNGERKGDNVMVHGDNGESYSGLIRNVKDFLSDIDGFLESMKSKQQNVHVQDEQAD